MGSTATSHCWRGRSTSISANLPLTHSSDDLFDFVFGDQKYLSNISSPSNTSVSSRLPHAGVYEPKTNAVCGNPESYSITSSLSTPSVSSSLPHAESVGTKINTMVSNPKSSWPHSTSPPTTSVSSSLPHAESFKRKTNNVVRKPQNDISIFATPLPEFVLEQRQRRISKDSNGSTPSAQLPQPPTCRIIEEGREWYGYRDEGIRQAAQMFGVTGPWIRPSCGTEDVDADGIKGTEEGMKGKVKKEKPFWHGNGRKVGVEERWMCVGDDEFGIVDELIMEDTSDSEDSVDSDDGIPDRSQYSEERPWWSVRWKNVFRMLGCGVCA